MFALKNPERLVLDLSTEDAGGLIAELQAKVAPADPYIAVLRVGVNRPGVTRVVLDLKAEVRPQVFALKPAADYGPRLVLDLYPLVPPDPLVALLELNGQLAAPAARRLPCPCSPARPRRARAATA